MCVKMSALALDADTEVRLFREVGLSLQTTKSSNDSSQAGQATETVFW